jgi:hypothetical protein
MEDELSQELRKTPSFPSIFLNKDSLPYAKSLRRYNRVPSFDNNARNRTAPISSGHPLHHLAQHADR